MKNKIGIALIMALLTVSLFAEEINWYGVDEGIKESRQTGKNIFLLITAPDWCGWCVRLENNVLSKKDIISTINENFIPVRILDTDNEIDRYSFEGFPTVWVMDSNETVLADIYTQEKKTMKGYLKSFSTDAESLSDSNEDGMTIPILLPEKLPVYVSGTSVVNHKVNGYKKTILPVINHYTGRDGGYVAVYKNGPEGAVYPVSSQIYVMALIRVKGNYENRIFCPTGYKKGDDITQDKEIVDLCNSYFPDYKGQMWIGGDTAGFFGVQQDGSMLLSSGESVTVDEWLQSVKSRMKNNGLFKLNRGSKARYIP